MPGPVFLSDDRVELRTVEAEDLDFLAEWRNDPAVRQWMPRAHPTDGATLRERFEGYLSDDDSVNLLACDPDGDDPLGMVSLFDVVPESGRGRLSAWLATHAQGEGYGTAATELLIAHAFRERRLEKLVAGALADNEPSRGLLETVGFEQEGLQRRHYYVRGEWKDRAVYGLLREEWAARREEAPPGSRAGSGATREERE